jgi:hypothetical protein
MGRGRTCLVAWPEIVIATVIKRTEKKRVVDITRRMTQGLLSSAEALLVQSRGGSVLNTAEFERFTFSEECRQLHFELLRIDGARQNDRVSRTNACRKVPVTLFR